MKYVRIFLKSHLLKSNYLIEAKPYRSEATNNYLSTTPKYDALHLAEIPPLTVVCERLRVRRSTCSSA